jgi:probable HAF family extracellular repeat protein
MRMRHAWLGAASVAMALVGLTAQGKGSSCSVTHYSLLPLPLRAVAINDKGVVAGNAPDHRAALWSQRGGMREVPLPEGFGHSEAVALNDRGELLGIAWNQNFSEQRPFLFSNGSVAPLPGIGAHAYAIGKSGAIAGEAVIPGAEHSQAVLWTDNDVRPLGPCCNRSARGVNTLGQIVGDLYDDHGRYHAYLWTKANGMREIGPADAYSAAIAINERGHVILQGFPEVFLYTGKEELSKLTLSPKFPSQPRAMNDCDVVVGSFGPFSDANRAFVWEKSSGFHDLNELVTGAAGLKLQAAVGINNRGEIVGKGASKGEDDAGFLLVPVSDDTR